MNLQEKLSGLKGLVSHSHSKRRYKGDLTVDMISPPLGDFRHTMHVGRGGDVFGDTSFLSNHGGTGNGNNGETDSVSSPDNKIGAFFSRTLRQIRRGSDNRPREVCKDLSPPPPPVSPIIKNAISLPRLDVDMPNGSPTTKVLFPSSQSTPEEKKSSYKHTTTTAAAYSDSLPSLTSLDTFTFDLGPSLMSEVFGLIDGHQEEHVHAWEGEEVGSACGMTNEGSEMDSATISYVDSLLREDCGGRKSPHGAEWEDEEGMEVNGLSVKVPDVVMGSPERAMVGVRMESERFQSATDVLARHYGVRDRGGWSRMETGDSDMMKKKMSYSYMDDEDEIKV
uniref:Cdc42 effector protein 1-like n=1 Tax=Stegastes partitus TaxID=144197 RepID=A0A3B4ZDU3_9TELE